MHPRNLVEFTPNSHLERLIYSFGAIETKRCEGVEGALEQSESALHRPKGMTPYWKCPNCVRNAVFISWLDSDLVIPRA
eukprot:247192-Pelagomonas_calceolata.AAC.1